MKVENRAIVVATPQELHSLIKGAVQEAISNVESNSGKTKDVMNEKQAAEYLGKKPGTLRQWRSDCRGPSYHKKGRQILYKKIDLDAWLEAGRTLTAESPDAPR
jgi:hypothetical protein